MLRLSVLDQAPIRKNETASDALQESILLAKLTDRLGYRRYWISEHHNSSTLAAAAPEVMIARLGGETTSIRLGSGGIMLPNHSTFKVAENFRLLEALFPGRIDLGIGRAPGGDRASSQRLNPSNSFDPQEYVTQIRELGNYFSGEPSAENLYGKIRAIPEIDSSPSLWALTSSGESAYLAAHFGMGLAYAQFINPVGGPEALNIYKEKFTPSTNFPKPESLMAIFAFCGETDEKAAEAAALFEHRLLSFEKGDFEKKYNYKDIAGYQYTDAELHRLQYHRQRFVTGTPDNIKSKLLKLAKNFDTNEIMIATFSDSREDRLKSYELLAKVFPQN